MNEKKSELLPSMIRVVTEKFVQPLEEYYSQAIRDRDQWYESSNGIPSSELSMLDDRICKYATALASIITGLMVGTSHMQKNLDRSARKYSPAFDPMKANPHSDSGPAK